jgi:hypothetical protein
VGGVSVLPMLQNGREQIEAVFLLKSSPELKPSRAGVASSQGQWLQKWMQLKVPGASCHSAHCGPRKTALLLTLPQLPSILTSTPY